MSFFASMPPMPAQTHVHVHMPRMAAAHNSNVVTNAVGGSPMDASACPAPPRPTLASTAALFLPDRSSPILLAPSESEIELDPHYYAFGSQLVAALVMFFLAYVGAYLILGWVRRREGRMKAALRAISHSSTARSTSLQRQHGQSGVAGGGHPNVRPRLYRVQPASPVLPMQLSLSLDLSDVAPSVTPLQRLRCRVRHWFEWMRHWPARWRRRRRAKAKQMVAHMERQMARARRSAAVSEGSAKVAAAAAAAGAAAAPVVSQARRMSASIAAFISRNSPSGATASLQHAHAAGNGRRNGRPHGSSTTASRFSFSPVPGASPSPTPSPEQQDRASRLLTSQLLGAFASDQCWLRDPALDLKASSRRKRAASITFADWATSAFSGGGGGSSDAEGEESVSPLVSPPRSLHASPRPRDRQVGPSSRLTLQMPPSPVSLTRSLAPVPASAGSSAPSSRPLSPSSLPPGDALGSSHRWLADVDDAFIPDVAVHTFPEEEQEREFLTYSLATFVLAVALVWIQLLVLSVLASSRGTVPLHGLAGLGSLSAANPSQGGVFALNELYLFSFCTKDLVTLLWTGTVWLSSVSLFILAPFAFLYFEAEGIAGRRGTIARMVETVLVLGAFTVLLYGSFHLLHSIIGVVVAPHGADSASSSAAAAAASAAAAAAAMKTPSFFSLSFLSDWLTPSSWWSARTLWWRSFNLESLYSNIWHFLPGLLMLLLTAHAGFSELILWGYTRATSVPIRSPMAPTKEALAGQKLNAITCELATLQRKWNEMHDPLLIAATAASQQGGSGAALRRAPGASSFSSRAIAPVLPSDPHASPLSRHARRLLMARITALQSEYESLQRELRPASLRARILGSAYVHNGVWLLVTALTVLLTWHVVLRVAQREARLIFRGSIFRWFRSSTDLQSAHTAAATAAAAVPPTVEEAGSWAAMAARAVWGALGAMKAGLGTLLSVLTGKGLGGKTSTTAAASAAAAAATVLPPLSPPPISVPSAPSFLSALSDLLRLLLSMLGGINGFQHPLLSFLADLAVIAFFLVAAARHVFTSPLLASFSPHEARRRAVEAAEARSREGGGSGTGAGLGGKGDGGAASGNPAAGNVGSGAPSPFPASDSSTLLCAAQFYTLNVVLLLLLTSSLPIAAWMLGLSQFDLLEFYPAARGQLAAGAAASAHGHGHGAPGGASFFLHLYNLTFLALTCWHATHLSTQLLLWVLLEQGVRNVEALVERGRVALGWARPHAPHNERFMFFRTWRMRERERGSPRTRWQKVMLIGTGVRFVLAPVCRALAYVLRRLWRVVAWSVRHTWSAVHAFLLQELSDDDDRPVLSSRSLPEASPSPLPSPAPSSPVRVESVSAADLMDAMVSGDAALTSQLLADVDAAMQAAAEDGEVDLGPLSPFPSRVHTRHGSMSDGVVGGDGSAFFARSVSAPSRMDMEEKEVLEEEEDADAETKESAADADDTLFDTPLSSPAAAAAALATPSLPHLPLAHPSPLFRSHQGAGRSQSVSYFVTPVPGHSRRLTTDGTRLGSGGSAGPGDVALSLGLAAASASGLGARQVTEADFPPVPIPMASIDEERLFGARAAPSSSSTDSGRSSATATPQFSPWSSPESYASASASSSSSSITPMRRVRHLPMMPPLDLSAASSGVSDDEYGSASDLASAGPSSNASSPWTPASDASSASAPFSATPVSASTSRAGTSGSSTPASARGDRSMAMGYEGRLLQSSMRLEPTLEEEMALGESERDVEAETDASSREECDTEGGSDSSGKSSAASRRDGAADIAD